MISEAQESVDPQQGNDARARLLAHFDSPVDDHPSKWSALWDAGDFLPWDKGFPNPALVDTLAKRQELLGSPLAERTQGTRKKALVPGCGVGYDVLLLASFGYDAFGLEVSETAVNKAQEFTKSKMGKGEYAVKDETVGTGKVAFLAGDFFKDDWLKKAHESSEFDLIYDYTFLSSLPPSLRPAWSLRMSQLLGSDGRLMCVEFPTYKPATTGGPPFGLPPKIYLAHLNHPGEKLPYDAEGNLKDEDVSTDGLTDVALERVAHWKPERTHEIGKGTDWVSVWRHLTGKK